MEPLTSQFPKGSLPADSGLCAAFPELPAAGSETADAPLMAPPQLQTTASVNAEVVAGRGSGPWFSAGAEAVIDAAEELTSAIADPQPPADLAAALDRFAATADALACVTPAGAYANCYAVSIACARYLRRQGVSCALLQVEGMRIAPSRAAGRWPFADHTGYQHWTVVADGWVIDWSARQFDADADWPLICPRDIYTVSWVGSQVWACELCDDVCGDERHAAIIDLDAVHRSIALESAGAGPYPDPRHDTTTPLERVCRCAPAVSEPESLVDREFAALLA